MDCSLYGFVLQFILFLFFVFQEEKTFFIDFSNALIFIFYQVFFCLFRIQSVGCFVVNSGSSLLILWNKLKKFRKYILNTSYSWRSEGMKNWEGAVFCCLSDQYSLQSDKTFWRSGVWMQSFERAGLHYATYFLTDHFYQWSLWAPTGQCKMSYKITVCFFFFAVFVLHRHCGVLTVH